MLENKSSFQSLYVWRNLLRSAYSFCKKCVLLPSAVSECISYPCFAFSESALLWIIDLLTHKKLNSGGWDLAEWLERLRANANCLGSIPASGGILPLHNTNSQRMEKYKNPLKHSSTRTPKIFTDADKYSRHIYSHVVGCLHVKVKYTWKKQGKFQ